MALLELKDIGKIYASEGAVAVGIRGVNLAFDKGEFVAVTGKSGSGKSTLLNVISGIDTYEEGELFIEGNPTSHYSQADWEEYRSKYISFIFQDYNIIESFTVLQNVELALTDIENLRERRKRAIELLTRVGMEKFLNHKGSKLSGGQKQRTVIARALAKDSPIILADEPTGNLDSQTSREILDLMREVSQDKLLIVVTHDFEEVKDDATRHIRIYDGTVESDSIIKKDTIIASENTKNAVEEEEVDEKKVKVKKVKKTLRNGFALGKTLFVSRPKLSLFLCLLLLLGSIGMFFTVVNSTDADSLFESSTMFQEEKGRVVLVKKDGTVFSDGELENLKTKYSATKFVHYDYLLDYVSEYSDDLFSYYSSYKGFEFYIYDYDANIYYDAYLKATYQSDYGDNIIGRYPEAKNECLLYLPVSVKPAMGTDSISKEYNTIDLAGLTFDVVGICYYTDNTITPQVRVTEDGYNLLTVFAYYAGNYGYEREEDYFNGYITYYEYGEEEVQTTSASVVYSFELGDKIYWGELYMIQTDNKALIESDGEDSSKDIYKKYFYPEEITFYNKNYSDIVFNYKSASGTDWLVTDNDDFNITSSRNWLAIHVGVDVVEKAYFEKMEKEYTQASIYFADNKTASKMAEQMMADDSNIIAVPSTTTYKPSLITMIGSTVSAVFALIGLVILVVFLAFFINLATSKTIATMRSDMAIMRSMGISVKEIRTSMYIRMFLCLIPSYIAVILVAICIYSIPTLNMLFTYIAWWKYLVIFIGVTLIAIRVTRKQLKKLFNVSVKKALRGDENS